VQIKNKNNNHILSLLLALPLVVVFAGIAFFAAAIDHLARYLWQADSLDLAIHHGGVLAGGCCCGASHVQQQIPAGLLAFPA
jgi:hypothetical protein